MSNRSSFISLMIVSLLLAGCHVDTQPVDVANFTTTRAPTQDHALYDGTFALFNDDKDNTIGPILLSAHLKKGEAFGFETDQTHVPFAFAGSSRIQLPSGRYRWQMTPDRGQTDWGTSNVLAVEVAVGAVAVVLIAIPVVIALTALSNNQRGSCLPTLMATIAASVLTLISGCVGAGNLFIGPARVASMGSQQ